MARWLQNFSLSFIETLGSPKYSRMLVKGKSVTRKRLNELEKFFYSRFDFPIFSVNLTNWITHYGEINSGYIDRGPYISFKEAYRELKEISENFPDLEFEVQFLNKSSKEDLKSSRPLIHFFIKEGKVNYKVFNLRKLEVDRTETDEETKLNLRSFNEE